MDAGSADFPSFFNQFGFAPHCLVNFVGGGGKTMLIHALMQECIRRGHILYTSTTRIHPPDPDSNMVILSGNHFPMLKKLAEQGASECTNRFFKFVVTGQFTEPDLLKGVPCDFLGFFDRSLFLIHLNEADGAARYSLKLPRDGEPVPMAGGEYLVPVIGIDCLGKSAGRDTVFRFQSLSSKFSLVEGETITPELASKILMHPDGVCKSWRQGVKIVPFINKVDAQERDADARALASRILDNGRFPVSHVVWGSVRYARSGSVYPS